MSEPIEPDGYVSDPVGRQQHPAAPTDLAADDDPRVVQMLSTEHWSVLSARSLAYNEAFARGGMFLSFLSMSMVALGLLAQGTGFGRDFRVIAAIVLGFDLVIGFTTYLRLTGAGHDDLVAIHGMSRIRHAYTEISPKLLRYFTAPVNDDVDSLMRAYPSAWGRSKLGEVGYVLSTTAGMVALIVCGIAGVLAGVVTSLVTSPTGLTLLLVGLGVAVALFLLMAVMTYRMLDAAYAKLPAMFPAEGEAPQ